MGDMTNFKWLIQIPRVFPIWKKISNGEMTPEQWAKNIFEPLFEATLNPEAHPQVAKFLKSIVGFDSVDDENKPDTLLWKPEDVQESGSETEYNLTKRRSCGIPSSSPGSLLKRSRDSLELISSSKV